MRNILQVVGTIYLVSPLCHKASLSQFYRSGCLCTAHVHILEVMVGTQRIFMWCINGPDSRRLWAGSGPDLGRIWAGSGPNLTPNSALPGRYQSRYGPQSLAVWGRCRRRPRQRRNTLSLPRRVRDAPPFASNLHLPKTAVENCDSHRRGDSLSPDSTSEPRPAGKSSLLLNQRVTAFLLRCVCFIVVSARPWVPGELPSTRWFGNPVPGAP